MFIPTTKWSRLFLAAALLQGIIVLAVEGYVFVVVQRDTDPVAGAQTTSGRTVPMFFSLFIFSYVYGFIITWDALRLSSMFQVVAVCVYQLVILASAAFQLGHIKKALETMMGSFILGVRPILPPEKHTWDRIYPFLIATIGIQAVFVVILGVIAWKLQAELAWLVYKVIHADLRMKQRLVTLQIYISLVKFNLFFFLGFLVQTVAVMPLHDDPEFGLSIAGLFIAVVIFFLSITFVNNENKIGTIAVLTAHAGAAGYLGYKIHALYKTHLTLIFIFAIVSFVITALTLIGGVCCLLNFDKGLRAYAGPQQKIPDSEDSVGYGHHGTYAMSASRMDLD